MSLNQPAKLYSKYQIYIATFIGGPLVGGYLMAHNFEVLGENEHAKKAKTYTIIVTLLLIALPSVLERLLNFTFPTTSLSIVPTVLAIYFFRLYQDKKVDAAFARSVAKASFWAVAGRTVLSIIVTLVLALVVGNIIGA